MHQDRGFPSLEWTGPGNPEPLLIRFLSMEFRAHSTTSAEQKTHATKAEPGVPSPQATPDIRARLGTRVRHLRRQRKWTQLSMARHFGLDRAFLSDVERGRKSVSLRTLEVIALGMQLSISDLLDGL